MLPHSGSFGGQLQPVIRRLNLGAFKPAATISPESSGNCLNEAIGAETPRDIRVGCQRIVFPFPVYLTGWEFRMTGVTNANFATTAANVGIRSWLWNNSDTTYLPTSLVSGSDTGRQTLATVRTAAGNDSETASSGTARAILTLPSTILVPAGEYTFAFAVDKTYTPVPEGLWGVATQGLTYAPFGGSATASIRRPYGYEVSGASLPAGGLANYVIPGSRALGDLVDANAWPEAAVGIIALCTGGL